MESDDERNGVVLDNGSSTCRFGFAGDDAPRVLFDACVGRPRIQGAGLFTIKESFIGDLAQSRRNVLNISYPMQRGIVQNWDDMQTIWEESYRQLLIEPKDYPLLITEAQCNPMACRERLVETLFENFGVPAMYSAMPAVLTLYASGRGSGVVIDSGDGVTQLLPIYEGYAEVQAAARQDFAGTDVTDYLAELLRERNVSLSGSSERELVREIKEKLSYVALDFKEELLMSAPSSETEKSFELPDGQKIVIDKERFRCVEALFQPSMFESQALGFGELVYRGIMNSNLDVRRDFCCNIIISGGNTYIPGFAERLTKEVASRMPTSMKVRVVSAPERKFSTWIGGSILASLSTFQTRWITKAEYEEHGPTIVHRQCEFGVLCSQTK